MTINIQNAFDQALEVKRKHNEPSLERFATEATQALKQHLNTIEKSFESQEFLSAVAQLKYTGKVRNFIREYLQSQQNLADQQYQKLFTQEDFNLEKAFAFRHVYHACLSNFILQSDRNITVLKDKQIELKLRDVIHTNIRAALDSRAERDFVLRQKKGQESFETFKHSIQLDETGRPVQIVRGERIAETNPDFLNSMAQVSERISNTYINADTHKKSIEYSVWSMSEILDSNQLDYFEEGKRHESALKDTVGGAKSKITQMYEELRKATDTDTFDQLYAQAQQEGIGPQMLDNMLRSGMKTVQDQTPAPSLNAGWGSDLRELIVDDFILKRTLIPPPPNDPLTSIDNVMEWINTKERQTLLEFNQRYNFLLFQRSVLDHIALIKSTNKPGAPGMGVQVADFYTQEFEYENQQYKKMDTELLSSVKFLIEKANLTHSKLADITQDTSTKSQMSTDAFADDPPGTEHSWLTRLRKKSAT